MAKLFATYLMEKSVPIVDVPGAYDTEQELWVSSNQSLAHFVTPSHYPTQVACTCLALPRSGDDYDSDTEDDDD